MSIEHELDLIRRGTAEIISEEELRAKLERAEKEGRPLKVKLGLDPTAPDLHVGNAVVLRKMRQFQDLGHQVIIIIGDFTGLIGDPSDQSATRPMLSREDIEANARTYAEQYSQVLDPHKTQVVFNSQWLSRLNLADLISLAAKLTVAQVLERDDFATRMRQQRPLGLHELLYPLCQAYDSVVLEADVEVGGTDQKFNLVMTRDFQRQFGQEPEVVLTMPLLVGTDGVQKMSKSLGNYIGITEPPEEKFGKAMSIPDELIVSYLKLCTEVPMEQVRRIEEELSAGTVNPVVHKRRLAREIVTLYDGPEAAKQAERRFDAIHVAGTSEALEEIELPLVRLKRELVKEGQVPILILLREAAMVTSKSEGRRLVRQGAVEWDGEKVEDETAKVAFKPNAILRAGRKVARIT